MSGVDDCETMLGESMLGETCDEGLGVLGLELVKNWVMVVCLSW